MRKLLGAAAFLIGLCAIGGGLFVYGIAVGERDAAIKCRADIDRSKLTARGRCGPDDRTLVDQASGAVVCMGPRLTR